MFSGMILTCNTYLACTSEGIYASPHIMKLQGDQAYDPDLVDVIKNKFYDDLKSGVRAPPAVIVPLRSALIPANPDVSSIPVAGGEYAPRKVRITKEDLLKHGLPRLHCCSGRRISTVQKTHGRVPTTNDRAVAH